jgi:hypothetical protein
MEEAGEVKEGKEAAEAVSRAVGQIDKHQMDRVRTRGDLAAAINASVDGTIVKEEQDNDKHMEVDGEEEKEVELLGESEEEDEIVAGSRILEYQYGDELDGGYDPEGYVVVEQDYDEDLLEEETGDESGEKSGGEGTGGGDRQEDELPEKQNGEEQEEQVQVPSEEVNRAGGERGEEEEEGEKKGKQDKEDVSIGEKEESSKKDKVEECSAEDKKPAQVYEPGGMYRAVRKILVGGNEGRPLNRKSKIGEKNEDGFCQPGDERWSRNCNNFDIDRRRNVSSSFDMKSGYCTTCLTGRHEAWERQGGKSMILSLSDQHFPANIPADEQGECIHILRIENGTLNELTEEALKVAPRVGLPAGSIVLLASVSQLAYDSAEFYAAEWKRCRNILRKALGDIMVLPGLIITSVGISDRTTIRGLLDINSWFDGLPEPELKFLRNSRKGWEDAYLSKSERGPGWADYRVNMRLPVNLREGGG